MSKNHSKSRNISKYHHPEKLTSIINNKKIRYHFDRVIREFSILPKKLEPLIVVKRVAEILFWATVYLAFSYLTITSTFELIQQYRNNQTTTNIKAVINNKISYLPNMTICFKINTWKLFNIRSTSNFNYTSAWLRFFDETISHEGTFKVNEDQVYDDEIYLSLFKYLAMIYEAERAWEPGLTQISTFHSEKSDDWTALKKVLMPNIERYNITLEQLSSVLGEKLCSLPVGNPPSNYLLDLTYKPSDKTECVAESKISFIGTETICLRLIGYQNQLQKLGMTERIYLNLYDDEKNQKWCQEITIDSGSESRSTPRRATTRNETHAYYYNRFPGKLGIEMDISIKALYRKLPYVKGDLQCSFDTSQEECENRCLRGWIRANCHCLPITFNLTDISSYRNCTLDDYSICLKNYTENATYLCTNKCVPLCEQWHYEYDLAVYSFSPSFVTISLKTFDYVIIEQVFTWISFEEFIGALGGALGIWLGFDFVIIIEFIVKLVTKLIKKILLRKNQNSENNKCWESVECKHREENVEYGIAPTNETRSRIVRNQTEYKENENEIDGTSIRRIEESEKQSTARKKRENNALKEIHVQQRRRHSKNSRADSSQLGDKMKNTDVHDGSQRNHKVNMIEDIDADQDEPTAHANNSTVRTWFLQKVLVFFQNGNDSANKPVVFLRLVEKLFWTAIYLVGSIFTILWCVDLIKLYLADEAVYFPSLIINRTVSLPPPSICLKYNTESFFGSHGNISDVLMEYFSQPNINRASFIQITDGINWSESLVSLGLFYFSILAASETNYTDVNFTSFFEWQLNRTADGDIFVIDDIDKSLNDILLPKLLEWNVTPNELRQKLGAELARMAELKITFTNTKGTTDIVNETSFYMAAITDQFFCYSLSYMVNFTDPEDVLEFSINSASYPQLLPSFPQLCYIFFSDYLLEPKSAQFKIYKDYVGVFDSDLEFVYGMVTTVLISIDGFHTSRPAKKDVKYCSPNTTKSCCRAQCRIELIEKLCKCSPTYWAMMIQPTSGLDECTFALYMKCLNFNASYDLACRDNCLPYCTARYFRSDSYTDVHFSNVDTTVIRFNVKDGTYMTIEEKPIFTFSDLLIKV